MLGKHTRSSWLTVEQVADMLRYSPEIIEWMAKRHFIVFSEINGTLVIPKTRLKTWARFTANNMRRVTR